MNNRMRLLKNAIANLGRGGLTGLVALVLPPVLVRHMTPAAYAVWVLILQACAYVGYFDFGLQTAVGRYIAFAAEKQDIAQRDSVFSTAFAGLAVCALLSIVLLLAAAAIAPWIFPAIPANLITQMRWALLIVGTATAVGLPASAWNGVFIGLQRNELPAMTVGGARLMSAIALLLVVLAGGSVLTMAIVMALSLLVSYAAQYLLLRRLVPDIRFRADLAQRSTAAELSRYCSGLVVMSFSMLLVTGLDLVLVARFDFAAVTPYSVAAGLITFVGGAVYAVINVIMPHAAGLHAKGDAAGLGRLVINSTRLSVLLLVFICMPAVIYAGPILKLWIGQRYVQTGSAHPDHLGDRQLRAVDRRGLLGRPGRGRTAKPDQGESTDRRHFQSGRKSRSRRNVWRHRRGARDPDWFLLLDRSASFLQHAANPRRYQSVSSPILFVRSRSAHACYSPAIRRGGMLSAGNATELAVLHRGPVAIFARRCDFAGPYRDSANWPSHLTAKSGVAL